MARFTAFVLPDEGLLLFPGGPQTEGSGQEHSARNARDAGTDPLSFIGLPGGAASLLAERRPGKPAEGGDGMDGTGHRKEDHPQQAALYTLLFTRHLSPVDRMRRRAGFLHGLWQHQWVQGLRRLVLLLVR